ncbi:hypothetical protein [Ketobacter sp.]|uniref:hypothetical protein n=1 Tax=Ketobacter sp. TaxID=2083498 RepID=UPI000F126076|nr:hypothetical protein [Ketobacter sp.]RLT95966.1 MAG: hypothetical protein D9N14_13800 [Ketobacter sp.]
MFGLDFASGFKSNAFMAVHFLVTERFGLLGDGRYQSIRTVSSQLIIKHFWSFAMRKAILLAFALSAALFSSSSFATYGHGGGHGGGGYGGGGYGGNCTWVWYGFIPVKKCSKPDPTPTPDPGPTAVPEIDGAGAGIAFALVGGLVLAYRERQLSKKSKSK